MKIQNRLKETIQNIVYDELSKHANEQLNMSSDAVHNQLSIAISNRILKRCLCNEHSTATTEPPISEYPRSTNLIQQRVDREEYRHGWEKKSEDKESRMRELEIHRSMYRGEG